MTTRSKKPVRKPAAKSKAVPKAAKSVAPRKTAPKPAVKAAPKKTASASSGVVYASALGEMIAKRLGRR